MPKKKTEEEQKQKKSRARLPRRSLSRTIERLENRKKTHDRRVAKKTAKLKKRIQILETKGVVYRPENDDLPLGVHHRRLRRNARRKSIVGDPIRKRSRVKKQQPEEAEDEA